jgi:putative ABC transport system permease protein
MLAVFDTQVLSIFRRQKEIGTYIALGYTRREVVGLFTVEGAMHSVLAAVVAALYGFPFLWWQAKGGMDHAY